MPRLATPLLFLIFFSSAILFAPPESGSSIAKWMLNEQTRIDRNVDETKIVPPDIANQKLEYRPDSQMWFELPSVWVPASELKVAELTDLIPEKLRPDLYRVNDGKKEYRLFIHPESRKFYGDLLKKYPEVIEHRATATSSSRSVLVEPMHHPNFRYFAKLSLDVLLGGVARTIPEGEAARSVGATQFFNDHESAIHSNFRNIPEVLGLIPKGMDRGAQLIRLIPPDVESGKSQLVPLFSLYARNGEGPTLLEKLSKSEKLSPRQFVQKKIIEPFAKGWVDWAIKGGLVAEAHAQNVLMELSSDGKATGNFYLRDGGGIYVRPNVAAVEAGELAKLPSFHSFLWDYQKFADSAETQSLVTYFAGGFLFNVDRELKRLDPKYKKGDVERQLWNEVAAQISNISGLPLRSLTHSRMKEEMEGVLREARERFSGQPYFPLSHGLGRPLRVGLYSGTFDPPHEGHIDLIASARKQLGLDIVYIAPNQNPPHKPSATPFHLRKQMAKAAFTQVGDVVVDGALESAGRFKGPDGVLQRLMQNFDGDTEYFRIMGNDSFEYYEKEGKAVTRPNVTFLVSARGNAEDRAIPEQVGKSKVLPLTATDLGRTSTAVRGSIADGVRPDSVRPGVWNLIQKNSLYGVNQRKRNCQALGQIGRSN